MVSKALVLLSLLCAGPALAAPAYQVDKCEVALGEAISLTLNTRPGGLDHIDLAPLARNFELRGQSLNHDAHAESLSVTLYPLAVGRFELRLPGLPGRAPTIRVDDQSNQIPKVRFRVELDPERPAARQPFRLTVEACDDGSLLWQRPGLSTTEGLYIRNLDDRQFDAVRDGEHCTANRWQWAVTPAAAGPFTLALPTLEAGKFGAQLRYPPPRVQFDIQAIPAWLPMAAAVGRVAVQADAPPSRWPLDRPLARHFTVAGAYSPSSLQKLLALQLAGRPAFDRYAPTVAPLPPDGDSALPRFDVTLYASPDAAGRLVFPDLTFPWFDPAGGRLFDAGLPAAQVEIFDPQRAWLLRFGFAVLIAFGLALLAIPGFRMLRWRRSRRLGLARIGAAQTPQQLAAALCAFSLTPDAGPAPSLGVWLAGMPMTDPAVPNLVARLEQACYGNRAEDAAPIRAALVVLLERVRPGRSTLFAKRRTRPATPAE